MMARYLELLGLAYVALCALAAFLAWFVLCTWVLGWWDREKWKRAWHELSGLWNVRP